MSTFPHRSSTVHYYEGHIYQRQVAVRDLSTCAGWDGLRTTLHTPINIDNGLLNGVLFIDLKKKPDTIDHEIILQKLTNYGVDQSALWFSASYLCNRSQKCSVNGALSSASKLTCEVPQGSILGPLLFLIYINDLPNCLDISCAKMFADDTNIAIPGCTLLNSNKQPILSLSIFTAG